MTLTFLKPKKKNDGGFLAGIRTSEKLNRKATSNERR